MKNESKIVKLSELSIDKANVRKTGRGQEPKFAASIRVYGVLAPLLVRKDLGDYRIIDGGERFEALLHLKGKKQKAAGVDVTDDFPVRVEVTEANDAEARATSLAMNIVRADMHPVDEFEAFAAMVKDGKTVEAIAAENAMKVPEVRQALSLAGIAPEIRAAWREGKIDGEAAEAYAQTKDLEHQVRIFKKLKSRSGEEWAITQEIVGSNDHQIGQILKFVGQKEYEAAGHHVNASLFDDDDRSPARVDNVPALKAMAERKLDAECERLKKDGWGWVVHKSEAPRDLYAWRRLPGGGSPSKEQKALAGCTVDFSYNGTLEVVRGYIKPGTSVKIEKTPAQKTAAKKAKAAGGGKEPTISNALATRLSKQITLAAADALALEGPLALRVAIAALASNESPARIDVSGMPELGGDDRYNNDFVEYLGLTKKKAQDQLLKLLATWVAKSLSFAVGHVSSLPLTGEGQENEAALLNEIDPKSLNAALRKRFDAKDYFESASKELCLRALDEALPNISVNKALPKAKIAEVATANVPKTGWLPPELRIAGYDGPKAKAPPKPSKKKRL